MSSPWREVERRIEDLQDEADECEEWSDVERWRAFITGENPRTGEPLKGERLAAYHREWRRVLEDGDDSEDTP